MNSYFYRAVPEKASNLVSYLFESSFLSRCSTGSARPKKIIFIFFVSQSATSLSSGTAEGPAGLWRLAAPTRLIKTLTNFAPGGAADGIVV